MKHFRLNIEYKKALDRFRGNPPRFIYSLNLERAIFIKG